MKLTNIIPASPTCDLVEIENEQAVTDSVKVAEVFGKKHFNVLRDIQDKILPNVSKSFNELNFELVNYKDNKGEYRPKYRMTRDGFTMVAMGYTGAKAIQFKEAYIEDTSDALIDVANTTINDLNVPGVIWYGWTPYDDPHDDANIIVFGADISIKSVKVYEIADIPKVTPTEQPQTGPIHKTIDILFLGNVHTLSCWYLQHDDATGFDLLPYAVDGTPTPNAISTENLCTCISAYYEEQGIPASDYRVVITDVPMDRSMAKEYIQARGKNVVQTTTTDTPGKGKPWYGWNDNEV